MGEEFKAKLDEIAATEGWNDSTLSEVLIDFIAERGDLDTQGRCLAYLRERTAVGMEEREAALERLEARKANRPERKNNSALPAGSPMYYYCQICGHLAQTLPESHREKPRPHCEECAKLKSRGWI